MTFLSKSRNQFMYIDNLYVIVVESMHSYGFPGDTT